MPRQKGAESTSTTPKAPEQWEDAVWRQYCSGKRVIAELCRVSGANGGPTHWHTIRDFVRKRRTDVAAVYDTEDERIDYEQGLLSDLDNAEDVYQRAASRNNLNAAVGALRLKADIRERIAASRGVVTQRRAAEVRGEHSVALVTPEQVALMVNREKE